MLEKSSIYSALEEVKQEISPAQLDILKKQLESEQPKPSPQSQFNYAWGLIKSSGHKNQQQGIQILLELYRDEPSMRRECLYYLSMGSYKVGDYSNARRYAEAILKSEPDNQQALALKSSIEDSVTKDGLIGLGIAGGVLAVGVGIIGALVRKKR